MKDSKLPNEFSSPDTTASKEDGDDIKLKKIAENDSQCLDGSAM